VISASRAPRSSEASIGYVPEELPKVWYDGLAETYESFLDEHSQYYLPAADALRRLLGRGPGSCADIGCGTGHFVAVAHELGWTVTGVELSLDQIDRAKAKHHGVELVHADAVALPFEDQSFDAAYSTFTHTDFDDFPQAMAGRG
jgi:ubiquinone/menaquinone biosynthesis C-methylase UbiE